MKQPRPQLEAVPDGRAAFVRSYPPVARACTIIELLVAVAIIILLLRILIVAVNAATKTGQKARTQALMTAISQGLVHFKAEIGYLPPVLRNDRRLVDWRGQNLIGNDADDIKPTAGNYAT